METNINFQLTVSPRLLELKICRSILCKYRPDFIIESLFFILQSYGGLRGAVAFSLVALLEPANFPNRDLFITTTLVIIIFTVVVQVNKYLLWKLILGALSMLTLFSMFIYC